MRTTRSFSKILIIAGLLLAQACGNDTPNETSDNKDTTTNTGLASADPADPETAAAEPFIADEELFAWVDNLNIRDAPRLDGKVVAKANERTALRFTGERSDASETIVLRGVAYQEPWLKVSTPDGTEGWVFGGAVKHEDEVKGNRPITDEQFNFPVFGSYNLAEWDKVSEKQEGEEVDYTITIYRKGGQLLEITQAEMGEFYYGWTYKVMEQDSTVIKERKFSFTAQDKPFTLEEKVVDYSSAPPVVYHRTQSLNEHYYQLNDRPMMVNAPWQKETL